jgi:O-antigen ligase
MLAYGSQAFVLLLVGQISDGQRISPEGNSFALAVNIAFHAISASFYVLHARTISRSFFRLPWLLTVVFYAGLSTAWSQDPSLTSRRSVILLATTLFGIYLGSRFELKDQIDILAWAMLLVLAASAGLAVISPRLGVESGAHLGNWRGVFTQKNVLGRIAVLALIAFYLWRPRYRMLRYAAVVFGLFMLGMSRSGTAFVVIVLLTGIVPLFRLIRTKPILMVPIAIVLLCVAAAVGGLLMSNAQLALTLLGRNATLTGRTQLWQACWVSIMKRPFLGYGFDAFWLGMIGESALVNSSVHWLAPTAHNGLLDLWLNLGGLGLLLFLFAYVICVRKAFRFYRIREDYLRVWPLAYLAFFFLYNVTEVTEMEQNSLFMMLFAALAATLIVRRTPVDVGATPEDEYLAIDDLETYPAYLS